MHFLDGVGRTATGPITIRAIFKIRLEDRFQNKLGGGLHDPVPDCGDTQRAFAAPWFRDHHPPHRRGPVRLRDEFLTQVGQPGFQALRLDPRESLSVDAWSARVGASQFISVQKDVLSMNLVVEPLGRSDRQAPPSPYNTAFSEGS